MYKKLMFLISLVILLGLAANASAAQVKWDNGGTGDSWCTPENWDGDALPGGGDEARIECDTASDGPTINCDVTVGKIEGPGWEGSCTHEMAIVSGNVSIGELERDRDFDGTMTFNISGGNIAVGSNFRFPDYGDVTVNITGGTLNVGEDFRGADEDDGRLWINISAGIVNVGQEMSIGDAGSGMIHFSGGTTTVGQVLRMVGRRSGNPPATIKVTGSAVVNVTGGDGIELQEDDDGHANMLMMGGTCNTTNLGIGMADGNSMCSVSGGVLTVSDTTTVGDETDGILNVGGGLMRTCHLRVKDDGYVDLSGGTLEITCEGSINCDGGVVNITGGTLVLAGDQCDAIADMEAAGCVGGYWFDAGGGCAGFRGELNCVFDGENTIVTSTAHNLFKTWSPSPADGACCQSVDVILSWCEGDCVYWSSAYLGQDEVAVTAAGTLEPEWKGYYGTPSLDPDSATVNPVTLGLWETWYWRVDNVARAGCDPAPPTQVTKGDVWSFMTGCELIPADINLDCYVNYADYVMLADDWTECVFFPGDVTP
jgi:hypothetical protein